MFAAPIGASLQTAKNAMPAKNAHAFKHGQTVEAKHLAQRVGRANSRWFGGVVRKVHANGACDIDYDDGDEEERVPLEFIRPPWWPKAPTGAGAPTRKKHKGAKPAKPAKAGKASGGASGSRPRGERGSRRWWHVVATWLAARWPSSYARKSTHRDRCSSASREDTSAPAATSARREDMPAPTAISVTLEDTPAPVQADRAGHSAGVLSPAGSSPIAQALLLLQGNLERALEMQGLLGGLRTVNVREYLFVEDGWWRQFTTFRGDRWCRAAAAKQLGPELLSAVETLGRALLLSSVQHPKLDAPTSLVLAAVQVTAMNAHSDRGPHFDNPQHGDLVVSLTLKGTGIVSLGACADEPQGVSHEHGGTWYALAGIGLTDYKHAVKTGDAPRLSVTYRYVKRRT